MECIRDMQRRVKQRGKMRGGHLSARAFVLGVIACSFVCVGPCWVAAEDEGAKEGEVVATEAQAGGAAKPSESQAVTAPKPAKPRAKKTPIPVPGGDPRGKPDLVVCSQNLKLFGAYKSVGALNPMYSKAKHQQKIKDLVARFMSVGCDVIAVQEVIAKTSLGGEEALGELAEALRSRTNRFFKVVAAPPSEGQMTNGFLIATDRAAFLQSVPYTRVQLPRISRKQRPRLFSRPPLEIQVSVRSKDSESTKVVSIVNFHFKSKRGAKDDPSGLEWETYRMEMSEGLRRLVESRHKESFASGESILMLLGDRNSNFDVASARILEGSLVLSSFAEKGPCRMSKRGVPLCAAQTELPRRLFSVVTSNESLKGLPGTFVYKGEYSWLDDIVMPAESLRFAWRTAYSEGEYDSGVVSTPKDASDHAMVYTKLNW